MSEVMQKQWTPEEWSREETRIQVRAAFEDPEFVGEIKARLQRDEHGM